MYVVKNDQEQAHKQTAMTGVIEYQMGSDEWDHWSIAGGDNRSW